MNKTIKIALYVGYLILAIAIMVFAYSVFGINPLGATALTGYAFLIAGLVAFELYKRIP